jgi:NADH:ubiquinone reductase (H+-translocating)
MRVTGFPAYLMLCFIHVLYLIGWGNRLGTLYTWLRGMAFAKNRAHRLITFEQANREAAEGTPVPPAPAGSPPSLESIPDKIR